MLIILTKRVYRVVFSLNWRKEREGEREGVGEMCDVCVCVVCVCALLELEKQMFKGDRQEAVLTNESIFD